MLEEKEKEFLLCSSAAVRRAGKLPPPLSTKWISHHQKFPKSLLQLLPRQELCSQTSPHFSLGSSLFLGGFRGVFLLLGLKTSPYSPSSHVPTWTFLDQERGFFPSWMPSWAPTNSRHNPKECQGSVPAPCQGEQDLCPPGPTLLRHSKPWKWLQCSLIGIITSDNVF